VRDGYCIVCEKSPRHRTYTQFAPYVDRWITSRPFRTAWATARRRKAAGSGSAASRAGDSNDPYGAAAELRDHLFCWEHALDIGALTPLFYCCATGRDPEDFEKIAARGSPRTRSASAACI